MWGLLRLKAGAGKGGHVVALAHCSENIIGKKAARRLRGARRYRDRAPPTHTGLFLGESLGSNLSR